MDGEYVTGDLFTALGIPLSVAAARLVVTFADNVATAPAAAARVR